jgi:hypothetical protein
MLSINIRAGWRNANLGLAFRKWRVVLRTDIAFAASAANPRTSQESREDLAVVSGNMRAVHTGPRPRAGRHGRRQRKGANREHLKRIIAGAVLYGSVAAGFGLAAGSAQANTRGPNQLGLVQNLPETDVKWDMNVCPTW